MIEIFNLQELKELANDYFETMLELYLQNSDGRGIEISEIKIES